MPRTSPRHIRDISGAHDIGTHLRDNVSAVFIVTTSTRQGFSRRSQLQAIMGQSPDFILKRDVKVVWVSISLETALEEYGNNVARQHAQQAAENNMPHVIGCYATWVESLKTALRAYEDGDLTGAILIVEDDVDLEHVCRTGTIFQGDTSFAQNLSARAFQEATAVTDVWYREGSLTNERSEPFSITS